MANAGGSIGNGETQQCAVNLFEASNCVIWEWQYYRGCSNAHSSRRLDLIPLLCEQYYVIDCIRRLGINRSFINIAL
jgi:hypothetical protein